jgi:hypothetical protein
MADITLSTDDRSGSAGASTSPAVWIVGFIERGSKSAPWKPRTERFFRAPIIPVTRNREP